MRETLTAEEVEKIRKLANTPGVSYKSIAEQYDIDVGHVKYIANNDERGKK